MNGGKLVNLTPHKIVVFDAEGKVVAEIEPSGKVARIQSRQEVVGKVNGIPLVRTVFGEVEGLPEPDGESIFIVSSLVGSRVKGRGDIISPDTSPQSVVRDEHGRIKGIRRWQIWE